MTLLHEALRQRGLWLSDQCIEELKQDVNAMSNYEFLELLDAIFDEAVRETAR
jgi:hypothetical protein